jgi:selenide,water dikinase
VVSTHHSPLPTHQELLLVGGGHSHVKVLKEFGRRPVPGVRLTVVSREVLTPYSGMLPGLVAGHYQFHETHIDLGPLARFAGARLIHDEVVRLDLGVKRAFCRANPPITYDVLSLDIGSTPDLSEVPGAAGNVVPVKPISNFMERWERLKARVLNAQGTVRIGTVGAGAGGVELTLAVQYALNRLLDEKKACEAKEVEDAEEIEERTTAVEFHLFSATGILPTHNRRVQAKFRRVLAERGVRAHERTPVVEVGRGWVRCGDGSRFPLDEILWVTQAGAAPWLRESGLAVDARGFVQVADTLESLSHPRVFAAGDVAAVVNHAREKAGVFAVRQGKPLADNLRRALLGEPLRPFIPQTKFLGLVSTGDRYAIASRGNWSIEGRWVWKVKDWIDRGFMAKYQVPGVRCEVSGDGPKR